MGVTGLHNFRSDTAWPEPQAVSSLIPADIAHFVYSYSVALSKLFNSTRNPKCTFARTYDKQELGAIDLLTDINVNSN